MIKKIKVLKIIYSTGKIRKGKVKVNTGLQEDEQAEKNQNLRERKCKVKNRKT